MLQFLVEGWILYAYGGVRVVACVDLTGPCDNVCVYGRAFVRMRSCVCGRGRPPNRARRCGELYLHYYLCK